MVRHEWVWLFPYLPVYTTGIYPWTVYCEGPPSFIWREPKKVALLFQFTIHIYIQNVQTNCEGTRSVYYSVAHQRNVT